MNIKATLDYLYSLQKSGIKFGLSNIQKLLEHLGNPHTKFKSIHVAGTNGKGSTSTFIASILSQMNFKTGLYTSPHLVRFNERIKIDGVEIDDEYIVEHINYLKDAIENIKPTFFEVTTAIAFKYFADNQVDFAVIETGLGGRLDSTNVINPLISVITKIDYDHREYLGDTLEKIAFEKAGIVKENVPVVVGFNNNEVKDVFVRVAAEKKSPLIFVDKGYQSEILSVSLDGLNLKVISKNTNKVYEIFLPLTGTYQSQNVMNAIATMEQLFPDFDLTSQISLGLSKLKFPIHGRFEVLQTKPIIILETAHNSDAIKNFLSNLNNLVSQPEVAIFGIMKDKEIDEVVELIEKSFDKIYLCQAKTERSLDVNLLAEKFHKSSLEKFESVENAIDRALSEANSESVISIFGSNYIVGEAIEYLKWKKIYQTA